MGTLAVNIYETPGAVVIQLKGEAGLRAADGLQVLSSGSRVARTPLVIFDMTDLEFAASLFLGLIGQFSPRLGWPRNQNPVGMRAHPIYEIVFRLPAWRSFFEFADCVPAGANTVAIS